MTSVEKYQRRNRIFSLTRIQGRAAPPNASMHGGKSSAAPKGNRNALKHGRYSAQAVLSRREIAALLKTMRRLARPQTKMDTGFRDKITVGRSRDGQIGPRFVRQRIWGAALFKVPSPPWQRREWMREG
jgi:hypothetical protein